MTVCALLRIIGIHQDQVVIDTNVPAYTRTLFGFAAIEKIHRREYQILTAKEGTGYSIADYALWRLRKAHDEPTQQEVADDARS